MTTAPVEAKRQGAQWSALNEDYVSYLTGNAIAPHTAERYAKRGGAFIDWCSARSISLNDATEKELAQFSADRRLAGTATKTVRNDATAIQWLLEFLAACGLREESPPAPPPEPWCEGLRRWVGQGRTERLASERVNGALAYARWCRRQGIDRATATGHQVRRFVEEESQRIS